MCSVTKGNGNASIIFCLEVLGIRQLDTTYKIILMLIQINRVNVGQLRE